MKTGIAVTCAVCGKTKAPRGRSVSPMVWESYCHPPYPGEPACAGYYEDPKPGDATRTKEPNREVAE